MTARGGKRGSVLMEAVLCVPLLLALVSGIAQFARIWEARFFAWLASYNGARAALVYNEREYSETVAVPVTNAVNGRVDLRERRRFYEDRGVVWLAAAQTLAWTSQTDDSGSMLFPTLGRAPNSSRIGDQVRIVAEAPDGASGGDERCSAEENGFVRVTVEFAFPLFYSIFDPTALARRSRANPDVSPVAAFADVEESNRVARAAGTLGRTFALRETVLLPKPWSTSHYPRLSRAERLHLLEASSPATAAHWWNNGSEDWHPSRADAENAEVLP